jgi:hypothetical protein
MPEAIYPAAVSLERTPTRGDDLPVINDSEAFQYVGKAVKVRGLVFAVPISLLGTASINFGREYPNQTFAGFIVSAQESLTLVARKTIPFLMAALSLILTASHSHAGLGWTLAQFEQQYGKPVLNQEQIAGRTGYVFTGEDYIICCFLSFLTSKPRALSTSAPAVPYLTGEGQGLF